MPPQFILKKTTITFPQRTVCGECENYHLCNECPYDNLDRKVQDFLKSQGYYECSSFKQKPTPPPPMTPEEHDAQEKELLKDIPEEFHSRLSYMAYERGHHSGMEECINHLRGLVNDLKDPIAAFQKRLTGK